MTSIFRTKLICAYNSLLARSYRACLVFEGPQHKNWPTNDQYYGVSTVKWFLFRKKAFGIVLVLRRKCLIGRSAGMLLKKWEHQHYTNHDCFVVFNGKTRPPTSSATVLLVLNDFYLFRRPSNCCYYISKSVLLLLLSLWSSVLLRVVLVCARARNEVKTGQLIGT